VSRDDGLLRAERMHQADDIADQLEDIVGGDRLWPVRLAIPPLIRCDDMVPGLRQRT
jgi:hypothetical protein